MSFSPQLLARPGDIVELPSAGQRILAVDDEPLVLEALSATLKHEGYDVIASTDPLAALRILKQQPCAVVLTDQRMPTLTGLEFLAQAKEVQPDCTRILMTGVVEMDTVVKAINSGEIYRFIVKPWIREEMLVAIKNGLQRFGLLSRNAALQAHTLAMNEQLAALNASLEKKVAREAEQNAQLEQLNEALQNNLQRSVELCFKVMQTFYPSLGNQARRAVEICQAMAADLKLSDEDRQVLEISGWLHDIGLVGVPRDLIKLWQRAPASLTDAERKLVQQHPIFGEELTGFMDHLGAVGTVIRSHHERFDGKGYPDRLAGDRIPWLGRLLAVAVSYGESRSGESVALETITHGSGTAFDPEAVRLFLRCRPKHNLTRRERPVLLSELRPGMVLAKGIYTPNGMLLIPEGQALNTTAIDRLLNHHQVNPINHSLLVYC